MVMNIVLNELKKKWHFQKLGRELHAWSSGFKALITWHSLQTLQEAREACGGQGYKSENRIGVIKNGQDVALTYEGDNHILLQAVTKTVLPDFLKGLKNGMFTGHFAYLNDRQSLKNADLSIMDPRSYQFAQIVLRRREAAVFAQLAGKLQQNTEKGISNVDAFNANLVLVEEAAHAHTELLMTELFFSRVSQLSQEGEKDIARTLHMCGSLFCASMIDRSTSFIRMGALTAGDLQRVHESVIEMCKLLRPHVLDLVDSFGIPPHLLAPIAFDYVKHNSRARL